MRINEFIEMYEYFEENFRINQSLVDIMLSKTDDLTVTLSILTEKVEELNKIISQACTIPEANCFPNNEDLPF